MRWLVLTYLLLIVGLGCGNRGTHAPGEHAATLVASPPGAVPVRPVVPEMVPDPFIVPVLPAAQRAAAIDAWVHGPLRGRDNDMAHLRAVTIARREDGTFTIQIRNQFRWTCALDFDEAGRPSVLHHCVSAEPGWYAQPADIRFQCLMTDTDEQCDAPYTLGEHTARMHDPASYRILRPLVVPPPVPHPSPPTSHVLLI